MSNDQGLPPVPGTGAGREAPGVALRVMAQYVKDLSFESPTAPGSLAAANEPPKIEASVDVSARRLGDADFEAELRVTAKARRGEAVVFIVELVYGGLFRIENAPQDILQPLLLIECPRILFPFARRIIADVTRDGGMIPLMLDPLDFAGLYRQQMAKRGEQPPDGANAPILGPAGNA